MLSKKYRKLAAKKVAKYGITPSSIDSILGMIKTLREHPFYGKLIKEDVEAAMAQRRISHVK